MRTPPNGNTMKLSELHQNFVYAALGYMIGSQSTRQLTHGTGLLVSAGEVCINGLASTAGTFSPFIHLCVCESKSTCLCLI